MLITECEANASGISFVVAASFRRYQFQLRRILGDPVVDSGGKGKSKQVEKKWSVRKIKNGEENAIFSSRLDFPLPPLSAPGSTSMASEVFPWLYHVNAVRTSLWNETHSGMKVILVSYKKQPLSLLLYPAIERFHMTSPAAILVFQSSPVGVDLFSYKRFLLFR